MRVEKENDFSSFSKILHKIDAGSLGEHELRMIKQDHSYLEKLRQQRIKIEDLKRKYDESEARAQEFAEQNQQLTEMITEKEQALIQIEQDLSEESSRREQAERQLQKYVEQEKGRSKNRVRELEQENEELKKLIRQKEMVLVSMEDEMEQRIRTVKENFMVEKRNLIFEHEERIREVKSRVHDAESLELRNLVNRQNKALKLQNEKYEEVCDKNDQLTSEIEEIQHALQKRTMEVQECEERLAQLSEEMEEMEGRYQQQHQDNKLKGQLEEIRKRMNELQKGEIERIEFIVNQMQ